MIYVDAPVFMKPNGRKKYAHMVADTLEELHAFAAQIGVKPHFFHKAKSGWHYDITSEQHPTAIAAGAKLVESRDLLPIAKNLGPHEKRANPQA